MQLNIQHVIRLYEHLRSDPRVYMHACPAYGVSKWVEPAYDIHMTHQKHEVWGPVERWGILWKDTFTYHRIDIWHDDFVIELEIHPTAIDYYHFEKKKNRLFNKYSERYANMHSLNWMGDLTTFQDWLLYQNLIHKAS